MSRHLSAPLGGLSAGEFLQRYWQKDPHLIRSAMPDLDLSLGPDDLRRMAGEPGVRSRLVRMPGAGANWSATNGPLDRAVFEALPAAGWTLLVQEVDRKIAAVAELLNRFRFVPNWRIDDVMISLAPDGGGVGPHVDRYDVFLLQVRGRRRWRIGDRPLVGEPRLVPGAGVRVLADAEFDREFVLEPGDMLYLPPRIPHEGVAVGESMTCSIGFRAPDPRELTARYLTQLPPATFEAIRYTDPDLQPAARAGEISAAARAMLRTSAASLFSEKGDFDRWVGCYVTRPLRDPPRIAAPAVGSLAELRRLLERGSVLARSAAPHFAWYGDDEGVLLFVGGESYRLESGTETLAELLCGLQCLDGDSLRPLLDCAPLVGIVFDLLIRGYLKIGDPIEAGEI